MTNMNPMLVDMITEIGNRTQKSRNDYMIISFPNLEQRERYMADLVDALKEWGEYAGLIIVIKGTESPIHFRLEWSPVSPEPGIPQKKAPRAQGCFRIPHDMALEFGPHAIVMMMEPVTEAYPDVDLNTILVTTTEDRAGGYFIFTWEIE